MTNKTKQNMHRLALLTIFFAGLFSYVLIINADRNLSFSNLSQYSLKAKFSQIHFDSSGNSFGGGIFWLPATTYNSDVTIKFNGGSDTRRCRKQLRGIYYNNARGQRLWPLDQETLTLLAGQNSSYNALSINGGLYTSCNTGDKYSIYGYIQYTINNTTPSYIIAGTQLDYNTNDYFPVFKDSLQYFNNETPLGFFWDSVGGIGFVGGQLTGNQELLAFLNGTGSINEAFKLNNGIVAITDNRGFDNGTGNALDTMWNILIQGNTILSNAVNVFEKKSLLGNLEKRTVLLSSTDINSATVINLAKKNAESLCRSAGYINFPGNGVHQLTNISSDIICIKGDHNLVLNVNTDNYANKTIILQNSDLTIKGSMDSNSAPLDIFIDGGNLYFNKDLSNNIKSKFNLQGFPSETDVVSIGVFLKGNFVINGLILGGDPSSPKTIANKLHIQGKFVSLNTPSEPSQGRIDQVSDLLGSGVFNDRVSLENVLSWYCDPSTGTGSDGLSTCGAAENQTITTIPFVVLDGNYPSKIIK